MTTTPQWTVDEHGDPVGPSGEVLDLGTLAAAWNIAEAVAVDDHAALVADVAAARLVDDMAAVVADLPALRADVAAALDPMICRTPEGVGGSQPGRHCAACCMGTGYAVGSQQELDLARLLARVVRALDAVAALHHARQQDNPTKGTP